MFIFGHSGFGTALTRPWRARLSLRGVILGSLLPDLIDKPLYYGLVFATGKKGAELGLISGTRTFGHTVIFLLLLTALAKFRKSRFLGSVCVGILTHFLLDAIPEVVVWGNSDGWWNPFLWPVFSRTFPVYPFVNWADHLGRLRQGYFGLSEIIGMALLAWALAPKCGSGVLRRLGRRRHEQ